MRVGELEQLTWGDVDEPRGRWRVSAGVSKSGAARWIEVPPVLFEAVTALVPREDRTPTRPVFQGFGADKFRTALTRACTTGAVPVLSPHDLRSARPTHGAQRRGARQVLPSEGRDGGGRALARHPLAGAENMKTQSRHFSGGDTTLSRARAGTLSINDSGLFKPNLGVSRYDSGHPYLPQSRNSSACTRARARPA